MAVAMIQSWQRGMGQAGQDQIKDTNMAYATNLQAMNAARRTLGKEWKEQAKVVKLASGEWDFEYLAPEQAEAAPAGKRQADELTIRGLQSAIADARDMQEIQNVEKAIFAAKEAGQITHDTGIVLLKQVSARVEALALQMGVQGDQEPSPTAEEWAAMLAEQAKQAEAQANQAAATSGKAGKLIVRVSTALKPTKLVWHIADEMVAAALAAGKEAPSRKEVQEECVRRGIATGTARTQYQAWKTAHDNTRANSGKAAEASARINGKGI